ncbi:MAG: twin-arginine translocation signal domain-containing protein [Desulfotalea sp.]
MKQDEGKRRSFLKHILAGGAAVAAVAVTRKQAQASSVTDKTLSSDLYKETDDFKKYYQSLKS